jgi:hypothetical protein
VVIEAHTRLRQAIKIRRFYGDTIATESIAHVVGGDEENITFARSFYDRWSLQNACTRSGR